MTTPVIIILLKRALQILTKRDTVMKLVKCVYDYDGDVTEMS